MNKIIKLKAIPEKSHISNGFEKIDYSDSYSIKKTTHKSMEDISKEIMTLPDWAIFLFSLRNKIVKKFGLKTDTKNNEQKTFFTLIEKNKNEIVLGEDDKHLNFRASIMREQLEDTIILTTVVHFNNGFGKVYFFLIKPFHKLIMRTLLKRQLKRD